MKGRLTREDFLIKQIIFAYKRNMKAIFMANCENIIRWFHCCRRVYESIEKYAKEKNLVDICPECLLQLSQH